MGVGVGVGGRVAVMLLEQVVPRRCEARLEPRQRCVDLGEGEADLENHKGVESATLAAPRRASPPHACTAGPKREQLCSGARRATVRERGICHVENKHAC